MKTIEGVLDSETKGDKWTNSMDRERSIGKIVGELEENVQSGFGAESCVHNDAHC